MKGFLDDLAPSARHAAAPVAGKASAAPDPLDSVLGLDGATQEQMLFYYDNPHLRPKGETTHFADLDAIFKWVPGWTNLLTAQPGVGKSEFKRQLLLCRAAFDGKKSLAFVPEDSPREAYFEALIHSLTGQDPDPTSYQPLSRERFQRAMEWVREYFYVIEPHKLQGRTPAHLLDICEAARAKYGIAHFDIDPWHKLDHSGQVAAGGIQPYLVNELGRLTDWCSQTQTYLGISINPRSIARLPNEAWPVPDSDHLSGGPTWADFAATTMALDRPNRHVNRSDPAFAIYTRKLKNYRRASAKPGSIGEGTENPDVRIEFNWRTARYEFNGASPLAAPAVQQLYIPDFTSGPAPGALPASTFEDEVPTPFPHLHGASETLPF